MITVMKCTMVALFITSIAAPAAVAGPDVTPLVSFAWLAENLNADELVVLDARSAFEFEDAHVPGALRTDFLGTWYVDRDNEPSSLPEIDVVGAYLTQLGIDNETTVVIVPAGVSINDLTAATWIYWVLKYVGHDQVAILDGGFDHWFFDGLPAEEGTTTPTPAGQFVASMRPEFFADTDYVAAQLGGEAILIDARPERHYTGVATLPGVVDRPGHIPGAINIPNDAFYDFSAVRFADRATLEAQILWAVSDRDVPLIVYCSFGQASSMSWFVFHELLGFKDVRLYEASMEAWSQREDLPLVAGFEP